MQSMKMLVLIGVVSTFSRGPRASGQIEGQDRPAVTAKPAVQGVKVPDETRVLSDLVRRFTQAQQSFDVATLRMLTAENYVEVSPIGEVDPRDKMLGFYAPEHRTEAPPLKVSDISVRTFGDCAAIIATISFEVPGRTVELRSTFVAHREATGWKLVSAQATSVRPKASKPGDPKPAK